MTGCTMRLGELRRLASEKDPHRAMYLEDAFENSDMTNREYVQGL